MMELREKHSERVENHKQWTLCTAYKHTMRGNGHPENERRLWHGTDKKSVGNICHGGFNRSYCGRNAAHYGDGVYFAKDFSYSARDTYSPPDDGIKYVFQCKVLTGYFATGSSDMKQPPKRPQQHHRYDSVVNDVNNPEIFVVFKDMQCHPEYLVSFKTS